MPGGPGPSTGSTGSGVTPGMSRPPAGRRRPAAGAGARGAQPGAASSAGGHEPCVSVSLCAACASRTSGSTCGTQPGPGCSASTSRFGSYAACTPRMRGSRRFGRLREPWLLRKVVGMGSRGRANDSRPAARSNLSLAAATRRGPPPEVHSIATDLAVKRALSLRKPPPDSCARGHTSSHVAPKAPYLPVRGRVRPRTGIRFPLCCTCWPAGSASACSRICCSCRCCGCRGAATGDGVARPRGLAAPASSRRALTAAARLLRRDSRAPGPAHAHGARRPRGVDRDQPAGRAAHPHGRGRGRHGPGRDRNAGRLGRAPSWAGSRPRP